MVQGTKVSCVNTGWEKVEATAKLIVGKVYTLARQPEVFSWFTRLYLEEIPNVGFNSTKFAEVVMIQGTKVKCINAGDVKAEWEKGESTAKLTVGTVYTLARHPEVFSWFTRLYLEEIPNIGFNSTKFALVI